MVNDLEFSLTWINARFHSKFKLLAKAFATLLSRTVYKLGVSDNRTFQSDTVIEIRPVTE